MSLARYALNFGLRRIERQFLARAQPDELRRSFETKARLLTWAPRHTRRHAMELGGVPALRIEGPWVTEARVLLYFHGGAFVFGSPETHAALVARLARRAGVAAVLPRYRLAPEHPFPAALDDALSAFDGLLAEGVAPERIVLGGDSAGGGLALALLGSLVAQGGPLPAGLFAFSPVTDLTFSGASVVENRLREAMLPVERFPELQNLYLAGHPPEDPRASPLFADFSGAGPIWLSVGDGEMLRDDTLRLAERMRAQGVSVRVELGHDLPHVWPFFSPFLPEARRTLDALARWFRRPGGPTGES
ncbi:alpha/beta hydrolase [Sulfitobacter sp. LCG007]